MSCGGEGALVGLQEVVPEGAVMVVERMRWPEELWGQMDGIGAGQGPRGCL